MSPASPTTTTRRARLLAIATAALTGALVVVYVVMMFAVDPFHAGRSDFTSTYVGASLWAGGHHADLYDPAVQGPVHARLIAPDTEGNLPFVNPPTAAVIAAPLTALPLLSAYRVFALLQLALVILAVVIAVRAAPAAGPGRLTASLTLALPATLVLLLLAQWDGVSALAVAAFYALWRGGRPFLAGFALAVLAAVAKPHLALGLAALLAGWRQPRVLLGALAGAGLAAVADVAAVGPHGIAGLVAATRDDATRWNLAGFLGFTGLLGSWLGSTTAVQVMAGLLSLLALGVCAWLGLRIRRRPERFDTALGAATLLSLVASPHLLMHDLVVVTPAAAWLMCVAARRDGARWPGSASLATLLAAVILAAAEIADLGSEASAPPGRLVPLVLVAAAAILTRVSMAGRHEAAT